MDHTGPPAYLSLLSAKLVLFSVEEKEGLHPGGSSCHRCQITRARVTTLPPQEIYMVQAVDFQPISPAVGQGTRKLFLRNGAQAYGRWSVAWPLELLLVILELF